MRFDRMITAVEAHAGGEPGRVITGGIVDVPGDTMFAKMQHLQRHRDEIRRLMLREPRGYPGLCCNILLPPTDPAADAGFVIMEQVEYPPMSGSNTICVTTVLLETGILPMQEPVTTLTLEAPAGLIEVTVTCQNGKVTGVTFRNRPAFAAYLDQTIDVPQIGPVTLDVAYGGMWYAIVDAAQIGLEIDPSQGAAIVRMGEMIKAAAREQLPVVHPDNPDIAGISILEFTAPPALPGADGKNTVVISTGTFDWNDPSTWTGVLDRSACGTGTCARMAVMHARGQLPLQQDFVHESILGTTFTGRLIEETTVGPYPAVVPAITGQAWIYGLSNYLVDPSDPFQDGFVVGDIWGGVS
ncbi:MAG: proline racemase family protein [Thermomicrobiales bacterium]|nr:proline racemase family protein [Thermomicrobiales bacterium]